MSSWHLYLALFLSISFTYRITRLAMTVRKARRQGKGKTSARPIFWIMTFSYFLFLGFGSAEAFHAEAPSTWLLPWGGLFLYASALILRERVMRDLGRYFSPDIEIRSGHRVVREGFYAWVRHPLLVCLILELIGLGLAMDAPRTLLVIGGGVYLPIILIRKTLEEKALVKQLGENYRRYQQEVGAFFPKWQTVTGNRGSMSHA